MKAATTAAKRLIREGYEVKALPKLTAEWEHNRFSPFANPEEPVTVSPEITPDQEWNDIYDLQSIVEPNRPRTGIAKTRFNNGILKVQGRYRDTPQESRQYLPTRDDTYKYWSSQEKSSFVNDAGNYHFADDIVLTLKYAEPVLMNKIVIGFETSHAKPFDYSLEVSVNGDNWSVVPDVPDIDVDGRITVWRTPTGGWVNTALPLTPDELENLEPIQAIRFTINSMNKATSHVDVLQLGGRIELDLTDFVEGYSRDFEISDASFIAPLGAASSNTASVRLDNMTGLFNTENPVSPLRNLIEKKVKFTLDLSYDATEFGGGADERIREFTMWTDSWGGLDQTTVNVALRDSSVFLQEVMVPKVFWGGGPDNPVSQYRSTVVNGTRVAEKAETPYLQTVGAIIWQLMDILGMTNYRYSTTEDDNGQVIPYFWPEEASTAWEVISDLAEGTQTAVYFDEYDVMQIKSRRAIFDKRETIDWNLDAIRVGAKLPDIVSLDVNKELAANDVEITYKPAKYAEFGNGNKAGFAKMQTVWEPEEDTLVLRATALTRDLLKSHMEMWIPYDQAVTWPWESLVNIRGEHLRYKGKEYFVHLPGRVEMRIIENAEQKAKADADSDPNLVWKNSWSGKLKIVERGVGGTQVVDHRVRPIDYSVKVTNYFNTLFYPLPVNYGITWGSGAAVLTPPGNLGPHDYMLCQHESAVPSQNASFGMRLRFPEEQIQGNKWATGGIYFAGDWGDAGYYLEISPTDTIEVEDRVWRHEISLYAMRGNGPIIGINEIHAPQGDHHGVRAAIHRGVWYDIDVRHTRIENFTRVTVYVNGVLHGAWNVEPGIIASWADQGKIGMFTRWQCRMEVEYLYGINQDWSGTFDLAEPDQSSLLDLKRGGFTSGFIEREFRWAYWSSVNYGPWHEGHHRFYAPQSIGNYVLDEFGPVVHEIREFNITFEEDSVPAVPTFLYFSNTAQVACTDYYADAFGCKFTLVNSSRTNAILKGQDKVTYGPDNEVDQVAFVYGRVVLQEDEKTIEKEDKAAIRKSGRTSLEFQSRYIQTDEAANALADWVIDLWAAGIDEVEAEIFGNPFIQLGDLVTVNYPIKNMYPNTHKYFVVGISNDFKDGLETELILRRAKI